jgi:hypothetical protein
MAIPVELITMGVSAVWSGLLTYASKRAEQQQLMFDRTLQKEQMQESFVDSARKFQGWHLTRRAIALMTIGSVIVWPMFAPAFFPSLDITIGWTELAGGFWPFTDAKEVFVWKTVTSGGIVVTPLMTHMCSAITGFFFGNQIAK